MSADLCSLAQWRRSTGGGGGSSSCSGSISFFRSAFFSKEITGRPPWTLNFLSYEVDAVARCFGAATAVELRPPIDQLNPSGLEAFALISLLAFKSEPEKLRSQLSALKHEFQELRADLDFVVATLERLSLHPLQEVLEAFAHALPALVAAFRSIASHICLSRPRPEMDPWHVPVGEARSLAFWGARLPLGAVVSLVHAFGLDAPLVVDYNGRITRHDLTRPKNLPIYGLLVRDGHTSVVVLCEPALVTVRLAAPAASNL